MDVKDLMIGDWMHSKLNDVNARVCCIECPQYNSVWLEGSENWQRHYMYEVEPIPITDEILKLNGFERNGGMNIWSDGENSILVWHWAKDELELQINIKRKIRYVHELQNAIRLCGIEKEIIL